MKPYLNESCSAFIFGLNSTKVLKGIQAAQFGQGRFSPNGQQKKWLQEHGISADKQKPALVDGGIEKWNNLSPDVMMALLRCKFTKDNEMGKVLLQFADKVDTVLFTEHTSNDKIWGDNMDGQGTNILGKLLTIRLKELVTGKNVDNLDRDYLMTPNCEFVKY